MTTETKLSEQSFEQLTDGYSGKALGLLTNLWNDCAEKSESDLLAIIKAFNKQIEKFTPRLALLKVENGDLVSETVMTQQKKYPTSEFDMEITTRYDGTSGKKLDDRIMYFYKKGVSRLNVDAMTVKQMKQAEKQFSEDVQKFLKIAEQFTKAQTEWNKFKKNESAYSDDEMIALRKNFTSADKAYTEGLKMIGLSREQFDVKGGDVKAYVKGLQQKKKGDIAETSAKIQILRAEVKMVSAILNKKRGNKAITDIRNKNTINTGMIDNDVRELVELPEDSSRVTVESPAMPESPVNPANA